MTFYAFVRAALVGWSRLFLRLRVHHGDRLPTSGPFVVVAPHRSVLDIPFVASITRRRIRFLAKQELFDVRVGALVFGALGGIPVARDSTDRAALRAVRAALAAGEPVAIFPEGTRRTGPALAEVYDGAAYVAVKLGVPVVPVGIGGAEQVLGAGMAWPRLHRVAVVVGEPIEAAGDGAGRARRSDVATLSATLRTALQAAFDEARTLAG